MPFPLTFSRPTIPFPIAEYTARLARLQRHLTAEKFDAILIEDGINRLYFTGFESSNGLLCVPATGAPVFLTDFRYLETATQALGFLSCELLGAGQRYEPLARLARQQKWRRAGYDGPGSPAALAKMELALPEVTQWASGQGAINHLRMVKSPRELTTISHAIRMNDAVFARALPQIRPGMTEWAIRVLLRAEMDRVSQGEAFDTIVCAGSNASRCHHHPSLRTLRHGQELLLDMGVKVDGYCSDMTRVVFFGAPSPRLREIYRIVLAANRRAIAGVRAGLTSHAADRLARQVIEKAGYGKYFGHSLGHGLGLQVHDPGSLRAKGKDVLPEGMVVTIEPGLYLPGVGGVRIEDVVVLRKHGCEVLTRTPKELLCL
ncbi:MAG: M24 family metallopeptidase [Kiritimatiellia bacterium]